MRIGIIGIGREKALIGFGNITAIINRVNHPENFVFYSLIMINFHFLTFCLFKQISTYLISDSYITAGI